MLSFKKIQHERRTMKTCRGHNYCIGWVQKKDTSGIFYFSPEIFENPEHVYKSCAYLSRDDAIAQLEKGIAMTRAEKNPECAASCNVVGAQKYVGWVEKKDENGVLYFTPEVFNDFETARKCITNWSRDVVIEMLTKGIQKTKDQKIPPPEDLINLPKIGQRIYVIRDNGARMRPESRYQIFDVVVTELGINTGEVWVVFGFYYREKREWFFTEKDAQRYRLKLMNAPVINTSSSNSPEKK